MCCTALIWHTNINLQVIGSRTCILSSVALKESRLFPCFTMLRYMYFAWVFQLSVTFYFYTPAFQRHTLGNFYPNHIYSTAVVTILGAAVAQSVWTWLMDRRVGGSGLCTDQSVECGLESCPLCNAPSPNCSEGRHLSGDVCLQLLCEHVCVLQVYSMCIM